MEVLRAKPVEKTPGVSTASRSNRAVHVQKPGFCPRRPRFAEHRHRYRSAAGALMKGGVASVCDAIGP